MANKEYEEKEVLRTKKEITEVISELTKKYDKETVELLQKLICSNIEHYNSYRRISSIF